jgi:hypothetical protein
MEREMKMNKMIKGLLVGLVFSYSLQVLPAIDLSVMKDLTAQLDSIRTQLESITNTVKASVPKFQMPDLSGLTSAAAMVKNLKNIDVDAIRGLAKISKILPPSSFGLILGKMKDLKMQANFGVITGKLKAVATDAIKQDAFAKLSPVNIQNFKNSLPNLGVAANSALLGVTSGLSDLQGRAGSAFNNVSAGVKNVFDDMQSWVAEHTAPSKVLIVKLKASKKGSPMDFANIESVEEKILPPGTTDIASAIVAMGSSNSIPWPDSRAALKKTVESLRDAAKAAKDIAEGKKQIQSILDNDAKKFVSTDIKDLTDLMEEANQAKLNQLGTKSGDKYAKLSDADISAVSKDLASVIDLLQAFDGTGEFTEAKATEMKISLDNAIKAFDGAAESYNNYDATTAEAKQSLRGVFGKDLTAQEADDLRGKFEAGLGKI